MGNSEHQGGDGKHESANRAGGGPGSSHQGGKHGEAHRASSHTVPGAPTSGRDSEVSGGGGERDGHHAHDEKAKGDRAGR